MNLLRRVPLAAIAVAGFGILAPAAGADSNLGTAGGLTYMTDATPVSEHPETLLAVAACPGRMHVVGGGVTPASSSNVPAEFWINRSSSYDGPDPDPRPDDGWIGRGYNRFGHDKLMSVFAICRARTVHYRTREVPLGRRSDAVTHANCPPDTHASGGGAAISGPGSQAFLNSSHPFDSGRDRDRLVDDGWNGRAFNLSGGGKRLTVYTACVSNRLTYLTQSATVVNPLLFTDCAATAHATGGGLAVSGPARAAYLNALYPHADTANPPDAGFVSLAFTRGATRQADGSVICWG